MSININHILNIVSRFFLLPALLLTVGMVWYYTTNTYVKQKEAEERVTSALNPNTIQQEIASQTNEVVFVKNGDAKLAELSLDSGTLLIRTSKYLQTILSSDWVMSHEITATAQLIEFVHERVPFDPDFVRKYKMLKEAIASGAAEIITDVVVDTTQSAHQLAMRETQIFPYYILMLTDIQKNLAEIQKIIKRGLKVQEELETLVNISINKERESIAIEEMQRHATTQINELYQMVRALFGEPNMYSGDITLAQMQNVIRSIDQQLLQTDLKIRTLHQEIAKIVEDFPDKSLTFELAKKLPFVAQRWTELGEAILSSAIGIEASYRIYCDSAPAAVRKTAQVPLRKFRLLIDDTKKELRRTYTLFSSPQFKNLAVRTHPLKSTLLTAESILCLQKQLYTKRNYLERCITAYKDGIKQRPLPGNDIKFEMPESRPAVLTVGLFNKEITSPLLNTHISIKNHPDIHAKTVGEKGESQLLLASAGKYAVIARAEGFFPRMMYIEVDPNLKKNYTLSLAMTPSDVPNIDNYDFLPPHIDLKGRVKYEKDFINDLIKKNQNNANMVRELQKMLGLRIHLIKNGFEPGEIMLPQPATPPESNTKTSTQGM